MVSLFYYSQLRFYYAKLLDTPEEDRVFLGFINPVVDSDDDIFEPESFSGVFNTSVNQFCAKKDKTVFKLTFRFNAFPEIPQIVGNSGTLKLQLSPVTQN